MDVLLGWSKERSRMVASELRDWLSKVLPGVKPWMSARDIDKGRDWYNELHEFLGTAKAVVVCVTPENVRSPWIYYEAGHIAAGLKSNLICPYLLDLQPSILSDGPLGRMQATIAEKEETYLLLQSFNNSLGARGVAESKFGATFEREWGGLAGTLKRIRYMEVPGAKPDGFIESDVDRLAGGQLSSHAREMLLAVGEDDHGVIYCHSTNMGDHFQTNGRVLNGSGDARETANWFEALKTLVRRQALEKWGKESYRMTAQGYRLHDLLKKSRETKVASDK